MIVEQLPKTAKAALKFRIGQNVYCPYWKEQFQIETIRAHKYKLDCVMGTFPGAARPRYLFYRPNLKAKGQWATIERPSLLKRSRHIDFSEYEFD